MCFPIKLHDSSCNPQNCYLISRWWIPSEDVSHIYSDDVNSSGVSTRHFWSSYEKCWLFLTLEFSSSPGEMAQGLIKSTYSPCRGFGFEFKHLLTVKKIYNWNPRLSDTYFDPPQHKNAHGVQTYMQIEHSQT